MKAVGARSLTNRTRSTVLKLFWRSKARNISRMSSLEDRKINALIQKAVEGRENAHCPYSKFRVGAGLLCEDGTMFGGCNVENAAYPAGICAEVSAISAAVSNGHKKFKAISVISDSADFITPCGTCRQWLAEHKIDEVFCTRATPVDGKYVFRRFSLDDLLPFRFGAKDLK